MNNPLNTNEFRHYLRFISLGINDLYEIVEPVGFDGANFVQDQESKRYARSVQYGSIDKLTFADDRWGIGLIAERAYNLLGDTAEHLDTGFYFLIAIYKKYGFQGKVEYVLEKNGIQFSNGMLDFTEKGITDNYTFLTTKLIQNDKVAFLKRQLDTKFNLFGTVNARNEPITPATTISFLRKAVPLVNQSVFEGNGTPEGGLSVTSPDGLGTFIQTVRQGVNNANKLTKSEIKGTLSFLSPVYATQFPRTATNGNSYYVPNDSLSFTFIEAINDLSNVKIDISNVIAESYADFRSATFPDTEILTGSGYSKLLVLVGSDLDTEPFDAYEIWSRDFLYQIGFDNSLQPVPSSFPTLTIPAIERGKRVFIYFSQSTEATFDNTDNFLAQALVSLSLQGMKIEFSATETALDGIIKGIPWIEAIKQADKFGSNIGINASLFDVNGKHYNNVLFGRRQVSNKIDTFTTTPKTMFESVEEVNCDYEPDETEIFIGHQSDFYVNEEIAVFNVIPDEDFSIQENDRCMINKAVIGYKTFEQDRTVEGTANAIHTEAEFRFMNDQVENVFERKFDLVRDPYTHQSMVDLEVSSPSTSTSEDDKVYIVEVTALAPSSFALQNYASYVRVVNGKLEILNKRQDGEGYVNWETQGFQVGDTFQILSGQNIGSYTIFGFTTTVLTLTPNVGTTPTYSGNAYFTVKFFYTNVLYVTRTYEGFISNPNGMQNANYSIKRNITNYFGEYLASCLMYEKKDIINGYFKSNGAFTSQLATESAPVTENANIDFDSLPLPLITPKVMTANSIAEFEDIDAYLRAYRIKRGFVRQIDSYGNVYRSFLQQLDHLWQENKLKTIGEQKYETEYLKLDYISGILYVDDAPYNLSGASSWWRFDNDYIKLYDVQSRPLSNYYRYDFVKLNGVIYPTKADLVTALESL